MGSTDRRDAQLSASPIGTREREQETVRHSNGFRQGHPRHAGEGSVLNVPKTVGTSLAHHAIKPSGTRQWKETYSFPTKNTALLMSSWPLCQKPRVSGLSTR